MAFGVVLCQANLCHVTHFEFVHKTLTIIELDVPLSFDTLTSTNPTRSTLHVSGSNVAAKEAGAITQKVAAFSIDLKTGEVLPSLPVFPHDDREAWPAVHPAATFIDTPGMYTSAGAEG